MWFLHNLDPDSARYHVHHAVVLDGAVDLGWLQRAINTVVQRHAALRTTFRAEGDDLVQVVAPALEIVPEALDCRDATREDRARIARERIIGPFNLATGPLLRVTLLNGNHDSLLCITMHHIVSDAWSLEILLRELQQTYAAAISGSEPSLPELSVQYAEYSEWERSRLDSPEMKAHLEHWCAALAGIPAFLNLPFDRVRPLEGSGNGGRVSFAIPAETGTRLRDICRNERTTLYTGAMAAFQALLSRYTGQESIAVGSPVTARTRRELEPVIGLFANTMVIRTDVRGGVTFRDLLRSVRSSVLDAIAHSDAPFDAVVERLKPPRSTSYHPIFQTVLAFTEHNQRAAAPVQGVRPTEIDTGTTKFDLTLELFGRQDGALEARFEYNSDIFEPETIQRMGRHFTTLLEAVCSDPDTRVDVASLASADEVRSTAAAWNLTTRAYPRDASLHRIFEAISERFGERVALVSGNETVRYADLNARANRLATRLLSQAKQLAPGARVAIALPQSIEAVVAILAILKTGATYVPVSPTQGRERLQFVVRDCSAAAVITTADRAAEFETVPVVACDECATADAGEITGNLAWEGNGGDAAYILYTSGSTGKPKGVIVPHRAVSRLVINTELLDFRTEDRVAQIASYAFDASVFEIWGALLNGAGLVMIPTECVLSPREFGRTLRDSGVSIALLTTSLFNEVASQHPEALLTIRHLLVGGERANPKWFHALFESGFHGRLINAYGPTEAAVFAVAHEYSDDAPAHAPVPIGRAVTNATAFVTDSAGNPLPPGVAGEIRIGGDAVGVGYLNDPALTAERFVPDPGSDKARLYRTGDLGRWRPDGTIEFLGRMDRQLKIRGFRIEPGEVEAVLQSHPSVRAAAAQVAGCDGASRVLEAYVIPREPGCSVDALRRWALDRLPAYSVPARIHVVAEFPFTTAGKLHYSRLSAAKPLPAPGAPLAERFTPWQTLMASIWREVLGVDDVGLDDDFFEIGGTSLLAVRLMSELEKVIGRRVPVGSILRSSTLRGFTVSIDEPSGANTGRLFRIRIGAAGVPPLVLVHGGVNFKNILAALPADQPVWSLDVPLQSEIDDLPRIEQLAALYIDDLLRVLGDCDFTIAGYCFSGIIGFEIARQLSAARGRAPSVVLLDAPVPSQYRSRSRSVAVARLGPALRAYANRFWAAASKERSELVRAYWRSLQMTRGQESTGMFLRAARRYSPDKHSGRLLLIRAAINPDTDAPGDFDWSAIARQVEVHPVPCGHNELLGKVSAAHVAPAILEFARASSAVR